ncbi:hypothetical protein A9G30_03060 [Gilliamella sp. Fer4-1]|nr:hypothetical protein A9G30_03060 [Gilliamella apicola]
MALNGVSIAVYYNCDRSAYRLATKKDGAKIRCTIIVNLTAKTYDALPCEPYNNIDRFIACASMCGVAFYLSKSTAILPPLIIF